MDFEQSLGELRSQREKLDVAILAIEALTEDTPRRGRPPANLVALTSGKAAGKRRGRPPGVKNVDVVEKSEEPKAGRRGFTLAQRKAQAEKMKLYWAKRKRAAKKAENEKLAAKAAKKAAKATVKKADASAA